MIPAGTVELQVDLLQERATVEDLARWATQALADGFDSPSLRQLAGLDLEPTSIFEALPVLERTLRELGIEPSPDPPELLRQYELVLARAILASTLSVEEGLELLHRRVVGPLDHAWEVFPWCMLWEGNDAYAIGRRGTVERSVRRYAMEVLTGPYPTALAIRWRNRP